MILKRTFILIVVLACFSCAKDPNTLLPYVEGYWEIEEVTTSDGAKKEYTFSNTIDYIELTDSFTGFRTKVNPILDGSFETSATKERIQLHIGGDSLHIFYKTPFNSWKETILSADKDHLLILNEHKVLYLYKRYQPLELD